MAKFEYKNWITNNKYGRLNEQSGGGTVTVHGCSSQGGIYGFMPHTTLQVPTNTSATQCTSNYDSNCWDGPQAWRPWLSSNNFMGERWVIDPNNVQNCPSDQL